MNHELFPRKTGGETNKNCKINPGIKRSKLYQNSKYNMKEMKCEQEMTSEWQTGGLVGVQKKWHKKGNKCNRNSKKPIKGLGS